MNTIATVFWVVILSLIVLRAEGQQVNSDAQVEPVSDSEQGRQMDRFSLELADAIDVSKVNYSQENLDVVIKELSRHYKEFMANRNQDDSSPLPTIRFLSSSPKPSPQVTFQQQSDRMSLLELIEALAVHHGLALGWQDRDLVLMPVGDVSKIADVTPIVGPLTLWTLSEPDPTNLRRQLPLSEIPTRFRHLMENPPGYRTPSLKTYVVTAAERLAGAGEQETLLYLVDHIGWQERETNSGDFFLGDTAPIYRALARLGPKLKPLTEQWLVELDGKFANMPEKQREATIGKMMLLGNLVDSFSGPGTMERLVRKHLQSEEKSTSSSP